MARPDARYAPGIAKPQIVATELEREIRAGLVRFGERLQSESELVQRFAVSRATVRKGLEALSAQGLITTRVGIGSFVTFRGQTIDAATGWSRALADVGADAETMVLAIGIVEDVDLAERLGETQRRFVAVDRCRVLPRERRTISIERSRLPLVGSLADLPQRGLSGGSLHRTLVEAGLAPARGEEWADVGPIDDDDAATLSVPPGTVWLRTRRLTRTEDGRMVEFVTSLLDPSVFALHLEF